MDNLKSCPFCGAEAELYGECDMVRVRCSDCGANTSGWWDEPEEAAEDWNKRAVHDEEEPNERAAFNWEEAEEHLSFIEQIYTEIGSSGYFALNITIRPLRDRFNKGERTEDLYDEIMALE